jgi:carbon monoxide dehydrogenase subunit G
MPGAQLTETLDPDRWKAKMSVKLGPISLLFATDVARESTDEAARTSTLSANARETKGRGSARATIESRLAEVDGGTRVEVVTDLSLTGPMAQYGRGLVQDVAAQLTRQFADCLQEQLSAPEDAPAAPPAQARPVSGLRLGLGALVHALGRLLRLRKESQ